MNTEHATPELFAALAEAQGEIENAGCPQPETPIRQRAYAAGQHNTDSEEIQK